MTVMKMLLRIKKFIFNSFLRKKIKIKLILHGGLEKTGTSSLQNFFAVNKDKLIDQGILYPNVQENQRTSIPSSGNASAILTKNQQNPSFFIDIYKQALEKKCHTVILSSEIMTEDPNALFKVINNHKMYDPYVILFVREIYSFSWSYYQQDLKFCPGKYREYNETISPLNLEPWLNSPFGSDSLILQNYEFCKKDIVYTFFKRAMVPINLDELEPIKRVNRSCTLSEHNILDLFWKNSRGDLVNKIANAFMSNNTKAEPFRFYDKVFADKIYKYYAHCIKNANRFLYDDYKLPLTPSQIEGYVEYWDKDFVDARDIKLVIQTLQKEKIIDALFLKKHFNVSSDLSKLSLEDFECFIQKIPLK